MKRGLYRKMSDLSAWDLDPGCRRIVDQSTPARRLLKKKQKRMERKQAHRWFWNYLHRKYGEDWVVDYVLNDRKLHDGAKMEGETDEAD